MVSPSSLLFCIMTGYDCFWVYAFIFYFVQSDIVISLMGNEFNVNSMPLLYGLSRNCQVVPYACLDTHAENHRTSTDSRASPGTIAIVLLESY